MPAIAPIAVPVGNPTSVPAQAQITVPAQAPTSVPAQAHTPLSIGSSAAAHDYLMLLGELGKAAGLDAVGVAKAEPFASARQVLLTRKRQGLAGGMQFTYRNPARSTDPRATLPQADTLFVGALAVTASDVSAVGQAKPQADPQGGPQNDPQAKPQGQVANYAQRDYYGQLRFGLAAVASRLEADGWQAKIVIDDNALMDREAAFRAGLGWYGKNTCLLIPRRGSQFVLGSVITDAPLPAGQPSTEPVEPAASASKPAPPEPWMSPDNWMPAAAWLGCCSKPASSLGSIALPWATVSMGATVASRSVPSASLIGLSATLIRLRFTGASRELTGLIFPRLIFWHCSTRPMRSCSENTAAFILLNVSRVISGVMLWWCSVI